MRASMTSSRLICLISLLVLLFCTGAAHASGKIGIYGIRMVPDGADAEDYSRPGWGGGLHIVVPVPQVYNLLAGTMGFEAVNLLNKTVTFQDRVTGLRTEQQTDQNFFRIYLGGQIGGHGSGFVRPHAGINLALAIYHYNVDVVIPDDSDRENEIRQDLASASETSFGYDITLGIDLNFSNTIALDGGVRYIKSFNVPQQLADEAETIHPQYFQIYLGVGASFDMMTKKY
jgi:opacity protein-like surface antigen